MAGITAARRHEAFAREYVVDHNATAAYRRAGFKATGHAAEVNASKMLRKTEVRKLVAKLEAAAGERVNVDTDELVRTSLFLAHVDPADIFNPDGSMKPIHEIPREARLAIASVDVADEYEGTGKKRRLVSRKFKIKLLDKNAALDRLFKYRGMFATDNAQKADVVRQFFEAVSGRSRGLPNAGTQPGRTSP